MVKGPPMLGHFHPYCPLNCGTRDRGIKARVISREFVVKLLFVTL